ncbi:NDR1/HIN1-like protein 13 [Carica papaya]|uniref:NDR1/HIN1-like protein 13 n=1 Tax=Carica papaya TaxID=3649 RepID=UPI000B8CFD78|nr:NDR1/HIN1-like protein 13 [Carica papaya]
MAERVHPGDSPTNPATETTPHQQVSSPKPTAEKPVTPPGTYVIQIPKDQVYRVPPPENARRYQQLTGRKARRSRCCCCLCTFLAIILVLIVLAGIAAGVLYLVFRPEAPDYSVESLSIKGFNLTALSPISPEFDVTVRARNPNDKIGIFYEKGSSVDVFHHDVRLGTGALPVFFQPTNNVTVFVTALTGSGIELTSAIHRGLVDAQRSGTVPFKIKLRAPVRIKIGSVKTWTITVKVNCDVTVDKLTAASKVVSKRCDYGVNIWD